MKGSDATHSKFDPLIVKVSTGSLVPLMLMAVVFSGMAGIGLYRVGGDMWKSGWVMRIAALCLAFPGPLCVLALLLIFRVSLTLTSEAMSYQGPASRWAIRWENLQGITVHHIARGGVLGLISDDRVRDLPIGAIEFHTAEGRVCIRGMQAFRLGIETDALLQDVSNRWLARSGGKRLDISHVRMSTRDAWTLR